MTNPIDVKISCSKNKDGTFNAGVFLNDQQMTNFPVVTGDCYAIRDLWNKVRDYFPEDDVDIEIDGPCIECFPDQQ